MNLRAFLKILGIGVIILFILVGGGLAWLWYTNVYAFSAQGIIFEFTKSEEECWFFRTGIDWEQVDYELAGVERSKLEQYRDQKVEIHGRIRRDFGPPCLFGPILDVREIKLINDTSIDTSNTSKDSVQDWKTYRNELHNYQIEYPPNFYALDVYDGTKGAISNVQLPEYNKGSVTWMGREEIYFGADNGILVTINFLGNQKGASLATWLKKDYPLSDFSNYTSVLIAGQNALSERREFTNECISGSLGVCQSKNPPLGNFIDYSIYISKNFMAYEIKAQIRMENKEYDSLFNNMLSTFRFLEDIQTGQIPVDYSRIGTLQQSVDEGHQPWRLDPLSILKAESSLYGFDLDDSFILNSVKPYAGEIDFEAIHNGKSYIVTLGQPIRGATKIWVIKNIIALDHPLHEVTTSWSTAGVTDLEDFKNFFHNFQELVETNQKTQIAQLIIYPIADIKTEEDFIKNYDQIFNQYVRIAVLDQDVNYMFANYKGVMVGNGQIWFSAIVGKEGYWIIAINNE